VAINSLSCFHAATITATTRHRACFELFKANAAAFDSDFKALTSSWKLFAAQTMTRHARTKL
jgi:hypothetical protein